MSSLFTVAEVELARLGLAAARGDRLDVVVGGLGLGYTARAALEDPRVRSLLVVEELGEVIAWHERGLLPFAAPLTTDPRSRLVEADFFAMAASAEGFDPAAPGRRSTRSCSTSTTAPGTSSPRPTPPSTPPPGCAGWPGICATAASSRSGPTTRRTPSSRRRWPRCSPPRRAHVVPFANPITGGESANTVYVAQRRLEHPVQQRDVGDRLEAGLRVQLQRPGVVGLGLQRQAVRALRPGRVRDVREQRAGQTRRGARRVRRRGRAPARRSAG